MRRQGMLFTRFVGGVGAESLRVGSCFGGDGYSRFRRRGGYGANMKEFGVQFDGWREAAHKAST